MNFVQIAMLQNVTGLTDEQAAPLTITERKLRIATKALWKILAYADCLPTDAALEVKQAIAQIEERKIDLNSPLPVCGRRNLRLICARQNRIIRYCGK